MERDSKQEIENFIRKLDLEGYVINDLKKDYEELRIEDLRENFKYEKLDLECEEIFGKTVLYDSSKIILRPFNSLYELLPFLTRLINEDQKKLVFRGHSDANYRLVSSLLRRRDGIETESDYYFDIIQSHPERFRHARYHLDYLKVMQHYGADTRILDISTNFLAPIYFSVERNEDKLGELIVFDKYKAENNVKRLNSDTVEILASLAALDSDLKERIKNHINRTLYFHGNKRIDEVVSIFNKNSDVKRLVHEVGQVRLNFSPEINPNNLLDVYFSDSTFDNERITNQAGEFIIHGLIDEKPLTEKLNDWRYTEDGKKVIFLISHSAKKDIRRDLRLLNVMHSTIYPSLEHKINDIYNRNPQSL